MRAVNADILHRILAMDLIKMTYGAAENIPYVMDLFGRIRNVICYFARKVINS